MQVRPSLLSTTKFFLFVFAALTIVAITDKEAVQVIIFCIDLGRFYAVT